MSSSPQHIEAIYTGRKIALERRTVAGPRGETTYDVVRHPGAAVILPVLDDGRIVLIENHRPAVGRTLLELPAGTLDAGERPEVCAARELAEETGYRAVEWTPLLEFYPSPGVMTELMHIFVARRLTPGPAAPEPGEEIRVLDKPLDECLADVRAGRIRDAKTMLALLFYDRFVKDGAIAR